MRLNFLSTEAIIDIKANFDIYKSHLISEDRTWINEYLNQDNRIFESCIEVEEFNLQCNGDFVETDIYNSIELYSKLKNIPIKVAADERLWSWLALVYCWNYTLYRRKNDWTLENNPKSKQKNNGIQNSFFFIYGASRSQVVNTMSRLWWASYYTYDESRKDKFELTKFFYKTAFASNVVLLESSKITANKEIRLGLLSALMDWCNANNKNLKREYLVNSSKYLNIIGGVSILDTYKRKDIYNLTMQYLNKAFS